MVHQLIDENHEHLTQSLYKPISQTGQFVKF
jgi:hypothetical protein